MAFEVGTCHRRRDLALYDAVVALDVIEHIPSEREPICMFGSLLDGSAVTASA
jgi:2-polyprenyl-3-methyl-5-hydroxy-6-metoxy-1,4-benzoquinol methylase